MHRRCRQAALFVAALAFLVFLPSLGATFVYDDFQLVLKNEYVHALEWLPRAFVTEFWDVSAVASERAHVDLETMRHYYRPLVTVSFLLTYVTVGARAWAFHLTNVLLHAAASGLATRAAIRWTRSLPLGVAIGVFFAVHPARSENVVWISGRSDVLMLFFVLLSFEAFRRFERTRGVWALVGGLFAFAGAFLSKEPGALAPLLLLARDGRRPDRVTFGVPAVLAGAYAVVRSFLWPEPGPHPLSPLDFLHTLGTYAHRTFVPWPPTQYFDELARDPAGKPIYAWPLLLAGGVVVVVVIAAFVMAWRRSRTAFWLLVVAAGMIGPVLNLFGGSFRALAQDRFVYAPHLFVAAAVACLLRPSLQRIARQRAFGLAAAGVALSAIALVELRIPDYHDDDTFWMAELAIHPNDPRALHMLAQNAASRGDLALAHQHFRGAAAAGLQNRQEKLFIVSHFEEGAVLAAMLPDGRVDELRSLLDELWRVVEPSSQPALAKIDGYVVGGPLPKAALNGQHDSTAFYWDVALLATRLGDFRRAELAARAATPSRMAAHPLNGALVLARLGHEDDAKALVAKLRGATSFQDLVAAREYDAMTLRLDHALELTKAREHAAPGEREAIEAVRLAGLGAYWAAFRVLAGASLTDAEDAAPIVVQLLVACRFEGAARTYAREHLGPEGEALVEKVAADLPATLKATAPVPAPFDRVLAAAKHPL